VLGPDLDVAALVERAGEREAPRFPYPPPSAAWGRDAIARVAEVQKLAQSWKKAEVFTDHPPRPEPILRIVPNL
jgi:hypothetical protein